MKVTRLDTAHILCKDSILTKGGSQETSTLIGCFAYLVENGAEKILIDCGIEDLETVNLTKSSKDDWSRADDEQTVEQHLQKLGVSAESISKVFLTHSHYDHISQLPIFSNAMIYMTREEYAYLLADNPHKPYLERVISFLLQKKTDGKLALVEEFYENGDVSCALVGGHTPGSMIIKIEDCLFTGDAVFLLENIEKGIPIGFCADPRGAQSAVEKCRDHSGKVFTGHDMRCATVCVT